MSMGKRKSSRAGELFICAQDLPRSPGHSFYIRLNELLAEYGFDAFLEELCGRFYSQGGRPSIPPGVYFRMLLCGYFEGIGSERAICWRISDSLSLREFVGIDLTESVPDHSSLSVIRNRFDEEVFESVFVKVMEILKSGGLLKGQTLGIDATILEANASLRNIVRRDSKETYRDYIGRLADEEREAEGKPGLADAREARQRDRKRKEKGKNEKWESPADPDAQITKTKRGSIRLGHKVEHAVDMDTGAIVGVEIFGGANGDTSTMPDTLDTALKNLGQAGGPTPKSAVADSGYLSDAILELLEQYGLKIYIAPKHQKRKFGENQEAQRRRHQRNLRMNSNSRGKRLQRQRGEKVERPFQHLYDRGDLRQLTLRGAVNNRKRLLIQAVGFNLGLIMRKAFNSGVPRAMAEASSIFFTHLRLLLAIQRPISLLCSSELGGMKNLT